MNQSLVISTEVREYYSSFEEIHRRYCSNTVEHSQTFFNPIGVLYFKIVGVDDYLAGSTNCPYVHNYQPSLIPFKGVR